MTAVRKSSPFTRMTQPSSCLTEIVLGPVKVPQPLISSILFFFIRKWTPLTMPAATWRLRACVGL